MGVKLGKLNVKLVTETAEFNKGMDRSRKKVSSFKDTVSKAGSALKSFAKVAISVGAILGGVFLAGVRSAVKWVDTLAKTADKLGATTEELMTMQFAAELSGISVETLNMALQRMVRRVADAAQGAGPAAQALEEMGLNAKALNRMSPGQILTQILTAMEKIGNQGNKVKSAFAIFDSEGVSMVNMTAKGLQEAADALERMGGLISRDDALLIEEVNNQLTALGYSFKTMFAQVAVQVVPMITEMMVAINALAPGGKAGAWIGEAIVSFFKGFSEALNFARQALLGFAVGVMWILRGLSEVVSKLFDLASAINQYIADKLSTGSDIAGGVVAGITGNTYLGSLVTGAGKEIAGFGNVVAMAQKGFAEYMDSWAVGFEESAFIHLQGMEILEKEHNDFWDAVQERINMAHATIEANKAKAAAEKAAADKAAFNEKFLWGPLRSAKERIMEGYDAGKTFYKDLMAGKYKPEQITGTASARQAEWKYNAPGGVSRTPEQMQLKEEQKQNETLKAMLEELREIKNKAVSGGAIAQ